MAQTESILVALATYNEIDNLPSLVGEVHLRLPHASVVVIDDNSPDGTGQWCEKKAAQASWFSCIHRPRKMGLGSALRDAMQLAIEREVEALITLDADWSHPPDVLPQILDAARHADVVIGSRYCPGGKIEGWPLHRRMASRAINFAANWLLGVPVQDCSSNYRLYTTSLLKRVKWDDIHASGYAYLEEILFRLDLLGARFAEVPILFSNRQAGESKINAAEIFGAALVLFRLAIHRASLIFRREEAADRNVRS